MQRLVLIFTVAALLGTGCRSANINRIMKSLPEMDNNIEPNVVPSRRVAVRKFVALTRRPPVSSPHTPGAVLELTCDAIGSPAPSVHWFKNDAPIYEHDVESNEIIDSNPTSVARVTSTLLVARTNGQDVYTCFVSAGLKTAQATAIVYSTDGSTDLSERSKLVPLAPRILVSYKVFVDTIGSNIVLPCRAKGHPRPLITWKDNKGVIVKKDLRMKVLRSGELVISALRWSDMGEFTCYANNVFGSQLASTFVYPAKAG